MAEEKCKCTQDSKSDKVEEKDKKDDSQLDKELEKVEEKVEKKCSKLGNIAKKTAGAIGSAVSFAGSGFVALGKEVYDVAKDAVKSAISMDEAMSGFIVSTGKGKEETERYQNVLENIYANNYGDSFTDIADKMSMVTQRMGEMSDADLQTVVESGYLLQEAFGIDMEDSIRGANAMMGQFGIDAETAYNLMAQGAQEGLNQNGELIDQIEGYSAYYADFGFSVEDMMNAMANGVKSGAYEVGSLNEAMMEFSAKAKDGSDSSRQAFEALGLNADEMFGKFAEGGEGANEAFRQVAEELVNMDDKVQQDAIGVALFGEKWGEVGEAGISALTDLDGSIDGTKDKLGEIEEIKYDNLGSMFEGLQRSIELILLPLGEMLIPLLKQVLEAIIPIVEEVLPKFVEVIERLIPPIAEIINIALPILIELADAALEVFMLLIDALMPIIDIFIEMLPPILDFISGALEPLIEAVKSVFSIFSNVFTSIFGLVSDNIDGIIYVLNHIVDFIKNVFTGNFTGAWENIKAIFGSIWSGIKDLLKDPLNYAIDKINGFIRGLNKIKIPDWVPGIGGKGLNLRELPRLRIGINYVPFDDFPALLHEGEAVLTKEEADLYRTLGGLNGIEALLSGGSMRQANYISSVNMEESPVYVSIAGDIHTHVDLDTKELGVAVSPIVSRELAIFTRRGR